MTPGLLDRSHFLAGALLLLAMVACQPAVPDGPAPDEPIVETDTVGEDVGCVPPEIVLQGDANMQVILDYIDKNLISDGRGFDMGPDPYTLVIRDLDWARPTGATMSVVKDGALHAAGARGYTAKPGHPLRERMTPETIIRIGSTSKLVAAAVGPRQQPVLYYDFRCPTRQANLALPGRHDEACFYTSADSSLPIMDNLYRPTEDLRPHTDHPDAAAWRYGNASLLLAQGVVEAAAQADFREVQQEQVFDRLSMCRTTYDGDTVVELGNYYQGYDFGWQANFNGINNCNEGDGTDFEICAHTQDEGNLHGCGAAPGPANGWEGVPCDPPEIDPMTWDAMGGLFSSSIDMGLLAAALVSDHGSGTSTFEPAVNAVLSGDKARDMMGATDATRVPVPSNYPQYQNGQHYGFGTFVKTDWGRTFVQHGGGGPGNSHIFIMEPESKWAVDVSFNSWNLWNNRAQYVGRRKLVEIILECYFSGYAHDVYDGVGGANGGRGAYVGTCTGTP